VSRRTAALAAALLLAVACRDGEPRAAPTTAPPTATPSPTPSGDTDLAAVRAAVAKAEAACPCEVRVTIESADRKARLELTGTWDPRRHVAVFRDWRSRFELRKVVTTTFVTVDGVKWVKVDYSKVPKGVRKLDDTTLSAAADPSFAFTLAGAPYSAYPRLDTKGNPQYTVVYDTTVVPKGSLLGRLSGGPGAHGWVTLDSAHRAQLISYDVRGVQGSTTKPVFVWVEVLRWHRPAPPATFPTNVVGVVDPTKP
jgi:hypothetical protein